MPEAKKAVTTQKIRSPVVLPLKKLKAIFMKILIMRDVILIVAFSQDYLIFPGKAIPATREEEWATLAVLTSPEKMFHAVSKLALRGGASLQADGLWMSRLFIRKAWNLPVSLINF